MESKSAVAALGALAQGTRLAIFRLLVTAGARGLAVGEIGEGLKIAPATLSFHLKALVHAALIVARQEGRFIFYAARYDTMNALLAFLTENCCAADGTACAAPSCKPTASTPGASVRKSARETRPHPETRARSRSRVS